MRLYYIGCIDFYLFLPAFAGANADNSVEMVIIIANLNLGRLPLYFLGRCPDCYIEETDETDESEEPED